MFRGFGRGIVFTRGASLVLDMEVEEVPQKSVEMLVLAPTPMGGGRLDLPKSEVAWAGSRAFLGPSERKFRGMAECGRRRFTEILLAPPMFCLGMCLGFASG